MPELVLASRGSRLALAQSQWVRARLLERFSDLSVRIETFVTKGDRMLDVTLAKIGGKGLFIKEIEEALLRRQADFAVHSMKDVPAALPPGLSIVAVPPRASAYDVLITRDGRTLEDLPRGAVIGTSSLRRAVLLRRLRPDLVVEPLRGNVDTRLRRLLDGDFDAVVLASAGLSRLGLTGRGRGTSDAIEPDIDASEPIEARLGGSGAIEPGAGGQDRPIADPSRWTAVALDPEVFIPAVGQGALGIEAREEDAAVIERLRALDDEPTRRAVAAERAFLARLAGSCHVPIGAHAAVLADGRVTLSGFVATPDGEAFLSDTLSGLSPDVGTALAERLIARGANEIIARFGMPEAAGEDADGRD